AGGGVGRAAPRGRDGGAGGRGRRRFGPGTEGGPRLGVARRRRGGADDVGDEAIAATVGGLDDPRVLRVVIERPPDLADADLEGAAAQEHAGPDRVQQLVLRDEPRRARGEVLEHREGLRREGDPARRAYQPSGRL